MGQMLDGRDRARRAADRVGGVEPVLRRRRQLSAGQAARRDARVGVTRDAHQHGLLTVGRDVHEDRRVRAGAGHLGAELRPAGERAAVRADQQDVLRLAGTFGRPLARHVDRLVRDVAREVSVDEIAAGDGDHHDDAEPERDPGHQPAPTSRRPWRSVLRRHSCVLYVLVAGPMPRPGHARSRFLKIACSRSWASCRTEGSTHRTVVTNVPPEHLCPVALDPGVPLMPSLRRALGLAAVAVAAGGGLWPGVTAAPGSVHEGYPLPPSGAFTLDGHGYGHGHGMSQFGAYGAALKGLTYQQIVGFYYPHTTLTSDANRTVRVLLGGAQSSPLTVEPRTGVATTVATSVAGVASCTLPTSFNGTSTVQRWRVRLLSTTTGTRLRLQKTIDGTRWTGVSLPKCDQAWSAPLNGSVTFSTGGYVRYVSGSTVKRYRGAVRAAFTGSAIYPVDVVPMESYLRAVVPSEMPSSWSDPALQAQAVAARTYATYVVQHPHPGAAAYFDLYADTRDQMYTGMSAEATSTNDAIAATAGKVLKDSQGRAVLAQFSSSSGGWTTDGAQPYLVAQKDPYDGVPQVSWSPHSWRTTLSAASIRSAFPSVGTVTSIVVTGRDGNGQWGGRVTTLTVHGTSGSAAVSGPSFRSIFGLRSEWFRIVLPPAVPTYTRAVHAGTSATVSWQPPHANGGAPVTGFVVVLGPGGTTKTVGAAARSVAFSGLNSGTRYTASVAALSAVGRGRYAVVTDKVARLAGSSAVATGVVVSKEDFADQAARAVVLASTSDWSHSLAAGPLAAAAHAPVLLTNTSSVPAATMGEIQRVLPPGGPVYLLGNTTVVSDDVRAALVANGFQVTRLGGATPAATARAVARRVASLRTVSAVVEVSDGAFADALSASPMAVRKHAVILLTHGSARAPETTGWLRNHPGLPRFAVGSPAHQADPSATAYVGKDAPATAAAVANAVFGAPTRAAVVTVDRAVPGLVEIARLGGGGPLLFARGTTLPAVSSSALHAVRGDLRRVDLTGSGLPFYDVESALQATLLP